MEGKTPVDPIRLVIADDHTFYREGVRTMLLGLPDIEVIGESADGSTPKSILTHMAKVTLQSLEESGGLHQSFPQDENNIDKLDLPYRWTAHMYR